jgi:hypothetical protein
MQYAMLSLLHQTSVISVVISVQRVLNMPVQADHNYCKRQHGLYMQLDIQSRMYLYKSSEIAQRSERDESKRLLLSRALSMEPM